MKGKYEDMDVRKLINISACLDPRFMLNYGTEEEITFVRQKIVEEGKIIARRLEETAPHSDPPKKKRKLVDILSEVSSLSTSRNEILSNEERVNDELTRYLQCPQPEVKSNPLQWWKHQQKNFPFYHTLLKSIYQSAPQALHQRGYSVLVAILSIQIVHT